jgi:hypothetical protein
VIWKGKVEIKVTANNQEFGVAEAGMEAGGKGSEVRLLEQVEEDDF